MIDRHGTVTLDCACCGLAIDVGASLTEDEKHACKGCGATCVVFLGPDDDAYFGAWKCKHGADGDEECGACESEEPAS